MEVINVPRVVDPIRLDHAIKLYVSGQSIQQCAATSGVGENTISRELHARGIKPRRGSAPRISLPEREIAAAYLDGTSEYELSKRYNVSRAVVRRTLESAGAEIRGMSEAGMVRAGKMTAEERARQAAAANVATRGRKATWEERCKRAKTLELCPSVVSGHELNFARHLDAAGADYRMQAAIDVYNVDFAIGPVAVEILGGHWHAYKRSHGERTPHILNSGWALLFVWSTPAHPLQAEAAHYAVAFADEASRNPSLIGEYRVVRGDGQLIATGRCEGNDFPGIAPSRHRLDPGR